MSYNKMVSITKSDTANIVGPKPLTDGVYTDGGGIIAGVFEDGTVFNFTAAAGDFLPISVKRVNSTTTTATGMYACYDI